MNDNQKKWLITGGVFVLALVLTVFAGLGIHKMTGRSSDETETAEAASNTEAQETEPVTEETPSADTEAADTEAADTEAPTETETQAADESTPAQTETEAAETETAAPVQPAVNIRQLGAEEIADIRANFTDTAQGFYISGDRDEQNRAMSCVSRDAHLNGAIGNVLIFGPAAEPPAVYFTFIMTTEYAPNTENLLNTLANYNVKALFLMDKPYAEHNTAIVQRMIAEGHEIGSMGSSLPDGGIVTLGLEGMNDDLFAFHNYMLDTFGYTMRKFYFSYDSYTEQAVALAARMGYQVTFYSANYVDYDHNKAIDVNNLLVSLDYQMHPGCIYSLHTTNSASIEVIPYIIQRAMEKGYMIGQLP